MQKWLVLFAATLGTAAYVVTQTSVGVALPHMQGAFSAGPDQLAWLVTSFVVGTTIMTILSGWLSTRFGRRRLLLVSIVGFTISSVMCGFATTLGEVILWRAAQGMLGAPLIPLGQAIAIDAFADDQQGLATALWGTGSMFGSVVGPIMGGQLVQDHGWQWVFWINAPIGVLAWVVALAVVPRTQPDRGLRLDSIGLSLIVVAACALQLMLSRGERLDWFDSPEIAIEAGVAAVALLMFIGHCTTARRPFVDPALFADRNFMLGQVLTIIYGALVFLPVFMLPLLLQTLGGYPEARVGELLAPRGVGFIVSMLVVGVIVNRVDPRPVLAVGLGALVVSGFGMSAWTSDIRPVDVAWTGFVQGIGAAVAFVPISVMAFSTIPVRLRTEGLAIFHLLLNTGTTVGVALAFNALSRTTQEHQELLRVHVSPFNTVLGTPAAESMWNVDELSGIASLQAEVGRQASMIAFNETFFLIGAVALATMPLIVLMRGRRVRPA